MQCASKLPDVRYYKRVQIALKKEIYTCLENTAFINELNIWCMCLAEASGTALSELTELGLGERGGGKVGHRHPAVSVGER